MNDQEFGDYIAELVTLRTTLTPEDFTNRVVALSSELIIARNGRNRARLAILQDLPSPECYFGHTLARVRAILGSHYYDRFFDWMSGQAVAMCGGEKCSTPHGTVVYDSDLRQFLAGGQPLD